MVTFVYLIFLLFKQVNFCKELKPQVQGGYMILSYLHLLFWAELMTSSVGWLHLFISSLPSFFSTFFQEL